MIKEHRIVDPFSQLESTFVLFSQRPCGGSPRQPTVFNGWMFLFLKKKIKKSNSAFFMTNASASTAKSLLSFSRLF